MGIGEPQILTGSFGEEKFSCPCRDLLLIVKIGKERHWGRLQPHKDHRKFQRERLTSWKVKMRHAKEHGCPINLLQVITNANHTANSVKLAKTVKEIHSAYEQWAQ
jgi:hypothetical protein